VRGAQHPVFLQEELEGAAVLRQTSAPAKQSTRAGDFVFSLPPPPFLGLLRQLQGVLRATGSSWDPEKVNDIHKRGGTFLGTSRGGHDTVESRQRHPGPRVQPGRASPPLPGFLYSAVQHVLYCSAVPGSPSRLPCPCWCPSSQCTRKEKGIQYCTVLCCVGCAGVHHRSTSQYSTVSLCRLCRCTSSGEDGHVLYGVALCGFAGVQSSRATARSGARRRSPEMPRAGPGGVRGGHPEDDRQRHPNN